MPEAKRYLSLFDSAGRKKVPMFSGLFAYFPDACAAVAEHSYKGNDKHNPGEPLHHARGKSMDHTDCILRHVSNYEGMDGDSMEVIALAWRAMALAQETLERKYGLTLPEGVTDLRAFSETNSLVGPNGEQAPKEFKVVLTGTVGNSGKAGNSPKLPAFKAPHDKTEDWEFRNKGGAGSGAA